MARVYLVGGPGEQKVVYTVDYSVGRGGENKLDDVYLVQFFLRVAMEDDWAKYAVNRLAIDGVCGTDTLLYIHSYIERNNSGQASWGVQLQTDDRVDPVRGGARVGSISQTFYTILRLNNSYLNRRGAMHLDIGKDPLFPAELRKSLYIG